jgi:hypothetical protein
LWFIGNPEDGYNRTVFGLRNKFGNDANIVQGALCIGISHGTIEEVDIAQSSGMIPSILTTRKSVEIKIDAKTIFTRPLDGLEKVPK